MIEPLPPKVERRARRSGRKRHPDQLVFQGILFVPHTGIAWEHLPPELGFGSGMTCWCRPTEWTKAARYHSESRRLRYTNKHLTDMFPYLPQRGGRNERLRSTLGPVKRMIRELAMDSDFWFDNLWTTGSTPVPCGISRPTAQHSNLAGWAGYDHRASHSRFCGD
ncbi:transposase [Streptomyces salyersiae]|uniref:transposase n=1 Tax=Streptomyces salyersiae TaxID=3075530 RepID=UPI00374E125F